MFQSVLVAESELSIVYSSLAGNLISSRQRNNYHLMLQWFIPYYLRCHQSQTGTASRDIYSHMRDRRVSNDWYMEVLSTKWTCTNQPWFWPQLLGLGQKGLFIRMCWVAQNTLCSIYGETTQLQNTVYLAPIKLSQIKSSVIWRKHLTVTYPVGIWAGTLTGSWWPEPISWSLDSDTLVCIRGLAISNSVALRADYLNNIVNIHGSIHLTINGERQG